MQLNYDRLYLLGTGKYLTKGLKWRRNSPFWATPSTQKFVKTFFVFVFYTIYSLRSFWFQIFMLYLKICLFTKNRNKCKRTSSGRCSSKKGISSWLSFKKLQIKWQFRDVIIWKKIILHRKNFKLNSRKNIYILI